MQAAISDLSIVSNRYSTEVMPPLESVKHSSRSDSSYLTNLAGAVLKEKDRVKLEPHSSSSTSHQNYKSSEEYFELKLESLKKEIESDKGKSDTPEMKERLKLYRIYTIGKAGLQLGKSFHNEHKAEKSEPLQQNQSSRKINSSEAGVFETKKLLKRKLVTSTLCVDDKNKLEKRLKLIKERSHSIEWNGNKPCAKCKVEMRLKHDMYGSKCYNQLVKAVELQIASSHSS